MFLVKPDAFRRMKVGTIFDVLENNFDFIEMEFFQFTVELIEEFYAEHIEKDFYTRLQASMLSGYSLAILVDQVWTQEQKDLCGEIRKTIGIGFNRAENGIHCSDSFDSDIKESDLIFGRH